MLKLNFDIICNFSYVRIFNNKEVRNFAQVQIYTLYNYYHFSISASVVTDIKDCNK